MMLFKKQQQFLDSLRSQLLTAIGAVQECVSGFGEDNLRLKEQMEALGRSVEKGAAVSQKQGMALEDMIEILEELKDRESLGDRRVQELEEDRGSLLAIIMDYLDIQWQLSGCQEDVSGAWKQQLDISLSAIQEKLDKAGIRVIDAADVPIDYECHDIISVESTDRTELHGVVKHVFSPGLIYKDKVIEKGKVAVWKTAE